MQNNGFRGWRNRIVAGAVLLGGTLTLTQCKDDPTAPAKVASANLTVPATRAVITAVDAEAFSFTSAGAALDPGLAGQSFTMTMTNTTAAEPTATIVVGGSTVVAATTFGSCIFRVTSSTSITLPNGRVITISNCIINIGTAGMLVGNALRPVSFSLGNFTSAPRNLNTTLLDNGTVTIGTTVMGNVPLTNATGTQ